MDTVRAIRSATEADLDAMASMAAELVRFHHALDPARFFLARGVEEGYRGWFAREIARPEAILIVAEGAPPAAGQRPALDGYCYGRVEARDWNLLLDAHAALHDIYVQPGARAHGLGARLVMAFCDAAKQKRAPRVVLSTATQNQSAQALFAKLGFRSTMIEMTRESDRSSE